jgi:hypothetical protein
MFRIIHDFKEARVKLYLELEYGVSSGAETGGPIQFEALAMGFESTLRLVKVYTSMGY